MDFINYVIVWNNRKRYLVSNHLKYSNNTWQSFLRRSWVHFLCLSLWRCLNPWAERTCELRTETAFVMYIGFVINVRRQTQLNAAIYLLWEQITPFRIYAFWLLLNSPWDNAQQLRTEAAKMWWKIFNCRICQSFLGTKRIRVYHLAITCLSFSLAKCTFPWFCKQ